MNQDQERIENMKEAPSAPSTDTPEEETQVSEPSNESAEPTVLPEKPMEEKEIDDVSQESVSKESVSKESVSEERPSETEIAQDEEASDAIREYPTSEENTVRASEKTAESPFSFLFEVTETVALSIAIVMIILTLFVRHSPVNGSSMFPSILGRNTGTTPDSMVGKDILLISDLFYTPESGDIVVIQTPTLYSSDEASMAHPIVKRVIAVGGDTLTIDFENWYIEINGEVFENGRDSTDYVNYSPSPMASGNITANSAIFTGVPGCTVTQEEDMVYTITVPEGYLFVMGDNRNNSMDSRSIGLIDERWVIGRSLLRIYPFDRIGFVE